MTDEQPPIVTIAEAREALQDLDRSQLGDDSAGHILNALGQLDNAILAASSDELAQMARLADAGGADGGDEQDTDLWDRAGRKAVAMELEAACNDAVGAVEEVGANTMLQGEDPSPEQVRAARRQLNDLRRILEEFVAPAAGCDEWGDPLPEIPHGRYREVAGCADDDDIVDLSEEYGEADPDADSDEEGDDADL